MSNVAKDKGRKEDERLTFLFPDGNSIRELTEDAQHLDELDETWGASPSSQVANKIDGLSSSSDLSSALNDDEIIARGE